MLKKLQQHYIKQSDIAIAQKVISILIDNDIEILFIALVGSQAHGVATETSDYDLKVIYKIKTNKFTSIKKEIGGIYLIQEESDREIFKKEFKKKNDSIIFAFDSNKLTDFFNSNIIKSIRYSRNESKGIMVDIEAMEIGHLMTQLEKSNSNIIELFYLPDNCVIYTTDKFNLLIENREKFLTKESKKPFLAYAEEQIKKMNKENKKFRKNPEEMKIRKTPLDFCTAYIGKKEISLAKWLNENGLNQKFCGIVSIPHNHLKMMDFIKYHGKDVDTWYMLSFHLSKQLQLLAAAGYNKNPEKHKNDYKYLLSYALFYDQNAHDRFSPDNLTEEEINELKKEYAGTFLKYKGIIKEDENKNLTSNQLRLSSIPKDEILKIIFVYNQNDYSQWCSEYTDYWNWFDNKNETRFLLNTQGDKGYDLKNGYHSLRILETYLELLQTGFLRVKRTERIPFYLNIKQGRVSLETLLGLVDEITVNIETEFAKTDFPEKIDNILLNLILSKIRD